MSTSVQLVLEQLTRKHLTKAEFASRLGVSQDYVYRVLNGRGPFPRSRETLERIASVLEVDPFAFAEYRERMEALTASARLVWERMREQGLTRDEVYSRLGGRLSRPYFNSILRGDQPFPTNRAYVQMFAFALELPPAVFPEFAARPRRVRSAEEIDEQEERCYNFFFEKMMADYGFAREAVPLSFLNEPQVLGFFLAHAELPEDVVAILARMGELELGFRELQKLCGVPRDRLAAFFDRRERGADEGADLAAIRQALHLVEGPPPG